MFSDLFLAVSWKGFRNSFYEVTKIFTKAELLGISLSKNVFQVDNSLLNDKKCNQELSVPVFTDSCFRYYWIGKGLIILNTYLFHHTYNKPPLKFYIFPYPNSSNWSHKLTRSWAMRRNVLFMTKVESRLSRKVVREVAASRHPWTSLRCSSGAVQGEAEKRSKFCGVSSNF